MSAAELNALEREVELTRAKFANDLARLRSPHNIAEFKEDLWAQARNTKERVLADLKARATANPLAVAALAAGVAWRLFHRPPIATLLIGLGLVGLLRTSPSPSDYANAEDLFDPGQWPARASDLVDSAKRKSRNGARRPAKLHVTPRHRSRRPRPRWRSAPPAFCAIPATRRGRGYVMPAIRHGRE